MITQLVVVLFLSTPNTFIMDRHVFQHHHSEVLNNMIFIIDGFHLLYIISDFIGSTGHS